MKTKIIRRPSVIVALVIGIVLVTVLFLIFIRGNASETETSGAKNTENTNPENDNLQPNPPKEPSPSDQTNGRKSIAIDKSFPLRIDDNYFPDLDLEITVRSLECKSLADWIGAGQFTLADMNTYAEEYANMYAKLKSQVGNSTPDWLSIGKHKGLYDFGQYHLGAMGVLWHTENSASVQLLTEELREMLGNTFGIKGSDKQAFIFRAAYFHGFLVNDGIELTSQQVSSYVDEYAVCRMPLIIKNVGQDQHDSCGTPGIQGQLSDQNGQTYDKYRYSEGVALLPQNRPDNVFECDPSEPANILLSGESTVLDDDWLVGYQLWVIPADAEITKVMILYGGQIRQQIDLQNTKLTALVRVSRIGF